MISARCGSDTKLVCISRALHVTCYCTFHCHISPSCTFATDVCRTEVSKLSFAETIGTNDRVCCGNFVVQVNVTAPGLRGIIPLAPRIHTASQGVLFLQPAIRILSSPSPRARRHSDVFIYCRGKRGFNHNTYAVHMNVLSNGAKKFN
jgi:hypothetical protein